MKTGQALRHRKLFQAEPCVLMERHTQYLEDDNDSDSDDTKDNRGHRWDCELQGHDSVQVGASEGAPIIVPVDGLGDEDLRANKVVSGVTTMVVEGGELKDGRLIIPPGATKRFGRMPGRGNGRGNGNGNGNDNDDGNDNDNDNDNGKGNGKGNGRTGSHSGQHWDRKLSTTGTKSVLAVRVVAPDASTTSTIAELSDEIFGTSGDPINLQTQFEACSGGKLKMRPATDNSGIIQNGVVEVTISRNVGNTDNSIIRNAALEAVKNRLGQNLADKFDHVMLCLPPGTNGNW